MQEDNEPLLAIDDDETPRSEARAFSQDELVPCDKCKRTNPPTRTNCLYCGADLPISDAAATSVRPTLRPLDDWEVGFSVIRVPDQSVQSAPDRRKIADLLRLDIEDVKSACSSESALPLARCASQEEAVLVQTRLKDLGVNALVVPDGNLDSIPLKRVRTVEFKTDSLLLFPTGRESRAEIAWQDATLIVVGRHIVRRLEVAERPDKKRGKEVVGSRELSTDAERLDIYANEVDGGWRIASESFDFSCLGELKTLLASKNFLILTEELRRRAHFASFDNSYLRVRQSLSLVWPIDQRTESLGLHKPRTGRINTGVATTSDNELQFTRYSKLLHFLRMRNIGLKA